MYSKDIRQIKLSSFLIILYLDIWRYFIVTIVELLMALIWDAAAIINGVYRHQNFFKWSYSKFLVA